MNVWYMTFQIDNIDKEIYVSVPTEYTKHKCILYSGG